MINTNSPTTQQLELISQMSNWGDVGTITVKAMARELLSLRQQIALKAAPAVEPAQSVAGPVSKEWDSLSSIGNRLHNISVEQHYAGNEKLSDELGEFASLLWIWERTRKPTVPPAIVEQIKAIKICTAWKDLVRLDDVLKILEAGNA